MTGSGHTGAINTFRAAGLAPAILTLLADGAKGVLAISSAQLWVGEGWGIPLAATMAVIGHCYPFYLRFRGGMGLTTAGGVFFVLEPIALAILICSWFPFKFITRQSSFASVAVALLLPLLLIFIRADYFVQMAGVGVGAVLSWRQLQVYIWKRRTASLPG